ncbi:translation initiation factor IF-2 [Candidatus Woesearchaeota archaeon]|nr:translation initiation factor IF-2 [Candidatus Woesearchaeota archaeon]
MDATRKLICTVLGHVDHGKSSILDKIRGTCIIKGEAGAITQAIGASIIPMETIQKKCMGLMDALKMKLNIPGLLFIDTPGHAAFTNLRKRGGSLADISILVVDINEGLKPQTEEAIEILKDDKTPFIIAANKVDRIPGWKSQPEKSMIASIKSQDENVRRELDNKLYELLGQLVKFNLNAERFDRVDDFTKQVAMVPTSAITGEGIPELMMMIVGLAQRYLAEGLKCHIGGNAKGTILEVKETTGLGTTLDVILYDGTLKKNDTIVIGAMGEPIVTKVRALLEPAPLAEMRDVKSKFKQVPEVTAATGVKISAPGLDNAVAGMPIQSCSPADVDKVKAEIQAQVSEVVLETDETGVIIKADSLGSLEALTLMLKEQGISIRRASIGDINKKDIVEAAANKEQEPLLAAVLGFNVSAEEVGVFAKEKEVSVITSDVIYRIIEDYGKWKQEEQKRLEMKKLADLTRPCKIMLLKGYVFRQSNPAIVGTEVLAGILKTGISLMKDGRQISTVKTIQKEQENISSAIKGEQVAVGYEGVMVGRQIQEGDILYSFIPEEEFRQLKELKQYLGADEIETLKEIAEIMRKKEPMWGI